MIAIGPALKATLMGFWDTRCAGKILTIPPDVDLQKGGGRLAGRFAGVTALTGWCGWSSGRPGESINGHSRCAKCKSSCDLEFILKKWNSKGGRITWQRCHPWQKGIALVSHSCLKIKGQGGGEIVQWLRM